MYLKLILCFVKKENQAEYTERQKVWNEIEGVAGLLFQLGGWNGEEVALKMSLWESGERYRDFHLNVHDAIAAKAGHKHLYDRIETGFFYPLDVQSEGMDIREVITGSSFLRVADCWLKAPSAGPFIDAQRSVWIPAMQAAGGMIGGFFSQHEKEKEHFLVSSFWKSRAEHDAYMADVPRLRAEANVDATIASMQGYYIDLLPQWTAIGPAIDGRRTGF